TPRTAPSARRSRSSPTASSSSAPARTTKAAASRSSSRAAPRPRTPTSVAPPPTTTSPSDAAARTTTAAQGPARSRRPDPQAQLLLLPREGDRGGLQEHQPAPALRLREGQDPLPPHHRRVPSAPAPGRDRGQAGPGDGAPPLLHRVDGSHPPTGHREGRPARRGGRCRPGLRAQLSVAAQARRGRYAGQGGR